MWWRTFFASSSHPTILGRWCLPTSPAYRKTCDPMRKGMLADYDNGLHALFVAQKKKESGPPSRDPVSVFVQN